ncbi:Uncharacterized protein FWK35_00024944 [Aphis craccivora]|uniref:Uncharacterized protein n=1 Tax=Aphis craccivora TaxID=307492 RepID=A0A6G0XZ80_APHCR|nr:Uncharacterized protein FWK35_00024944 [Aphis craccivora]
MEFTDGVIIVPYNWLENDKTKCFFPPGNNDKLFYKLVADMIEPKDNWNALAQVTTGDKLNDITQFNLSEVGTGFDEINKLSRKIRTAAKIYSSDEELESISELSKFTKFPSPYSPNMFHSPEKNLQHNDSVDSFHNLYSSTSKFHNKTASKTATIDTLNTTSSS